MSQPYGPPRPVTGTTLPFLYTTIHSVFSEVSLCLIKNSAMKTYGGVEV
jgi:hypothetical protein